MLFPRLGIYGWKEADENLLLATLLTGDPVLLVGSHGTAKTGLFMKVGQALGLRAISYDASKALFEDVLGFPNPKELLEGRVSYIASDVTIWDKEFVLIDELNRAQAEMQNKWLEIIRSRRVMGAETAVNWVWAAMNPKSYSATHTLDDALVGRFAMFVYPPEVLSMDEVDRARVACHMNGDDAPALGCWADDAKPKARSNVMKLPRSVAAVGAEMKSLLTRAAKLFASLKSDLPRLGEFLARFADLAFRETKGEVKLDGRRLGFIYRNLLANRAVELAKAEAEGVSPPEFRKSARYVVLSSIPVGLNDETVNREETDHKVQVVFDLLSGYFDEGSDFERTDRVYELFTTRDLMRKAEILLREDLGELAHTKAWNDLIHGDRDITTLAYLALQIEARRPGTVPGEIIDGLANMVDVGELSSRCIGVLKGESVEHVDEVEKLLKDRDDDLEKLIAISHVRRAAEEGVTRAKLVEVAEAIERDVEKFRELLDNLSARREGQAA
jgi:MoxR-like ATPase